jgi:hypothetical protein
MEYLHVIVYVDLNVPVSPKIMPFTFGDDPFHAGQSATLQCTVSEGDLPLNIVWTFNSEPISSHMEISTAKIGRRVSVLTIESVAGRHAGNYTCRGENSAGTASYTAQLVVDGLCNVCILKLLPSEFLLLHILFQSLCFLIPTIFPSFAISSH